MTEITQELANKLLDYDQETGTLTWKLRDLASFPRRCSAKTWNTRYGGKEAGVPNNRGYMSVTIAYKRVLSHRLIWLMVYGAWPDCIDHINGDRKDNRIANLRSVSNSENLKNARISSSNKSGVRGVSFIKARQKWAVSISQRFVGEFRTLEEAREARKRAEREQGYHPNHGRAASEEKRP